MDKQGVRRLTTTEPYDEERLDLIENQNRIALADAKHAETCGFCRSKANAGLVEETRPFTAEQLFEVRNDAAIAALSLTRASLLRSFSTTPEGYCIRKEWLFEYLQDVIDGLRLPDDEGERTVETDLLEDR